MPFHPEDCDCSRCVSTVEFIEQLLRNPLMFSDWRTKEDLFNNRMEQETRVEQCLNSATAPIIEGMQFDEDGEYRILEDTEVNSVILGIFARHEHGTKVFSLIEFQIALHAWLVYVNYAVPPLSWSTFLINIMQVFVPTAYWDEARRTLLRLGSQKEPVAEKLLVQLLIDQGIPALISDLRTDFPKGFFRTDHEYTMFDPAGFTILRRSQSPDRMIKVEDEDTPNRISPTIREDGDHENQRPMSRPYPDEVSLLRARVNQLEESIRGPPPDSPFNIHAEATERLFVLGYEVSLFQDRLILIIESVQEMIRLDQDLDQRIRALEQREPRE
ncbi:hypothetical protein N7486_009739 [Penicillium sp. IBT 16267x]|nr:hypothetical protein N7486_009739 [Penicillium sp. IBT 16267x]